MATAEALLTAEEFGNLPDDGRMTELVRGRIIELPPPQYLHGFVCFQAAMIFGAYIKQHDLGRVVVNDTGVVTERDPDTVRGADVAYHSFARLPRKPMTKGYPAVPPDLVIEVRLSSDRWRDIQAKVTEYLNLGVTVVVVIDPEPRTASLFHADQPPRTLGPVDELTLPECLGDFRVAVRDFFPE